MNIKLRAFHTVCVGGYGRVSVRVSLTAARNAISSVFNEIDYWAMFQKKLFSKKAHVYEEKMLFRLFHLLCFTAFHSNYIRKNEFDHWIFGFLRLQTMCIVISVTSKCFWIFELLPMTWKSWVMDENSMFWFLILWFGLVWFLVVWLRRCDGIFLWKNGTSKNFIYRTKQCLNAHKLYMYIV